MHPALRAALAASPFFAAVPLAAQTPQQASLAVTVAANTSPPSLVFSWPFDAAATQYTVLRRPPGTTTWNPPVVIPGGGAATSWSDTNVVLGSRYEYWFTKSGSPGARAFLTAGVEAAAIEDRGKLVLLVDATQAAALGARLDRLEQDLAGDGWTVLRHDVLPSASVPSVKALVTADVAAHPGQVKCVFLLGHVPVPYSGFLAPDGHPDHQGAWPADLYYGEVTSNWTDSSVNTSSASRPENRNVPGDGKFDQTSIPSDVDLAVGRVDLANMPSFALSETALLQQYLDKDHAWRHRVFTADARAVIDDNFGWFGGEAFAASGWRNFQSLVGPANVVAGDYFTTLNVPSGGGYLWSYGCGGGWYQGAGGVGTTADFAGAQCRSVFTMLFGSYFGDWDAPDDFLRAPLCSGWTLTNAWAGRPHWVFHPMGLGETVGYCTKLSQNDTAQGGIGGRSVHVALMGDPTLRQHVVAPPTNVVVTDAWPHADLAWTPSVDAVAGYHVYRAPTARGPFVRLTATPVVAPAFTDTAPIAGTATWLVRALRLETTPTGSYWNLSQGAFATATLPQQPAAHTAFGAGCYTLSDSFYQPFATAAAASAALSGAAITLVPANGGYAVAAGGTFVPPSPAATALALGDDGEVAVVPSVPMLLPSGGSAATLHVHSNGVVATAPLSLSPAASAVPDVASLLAEPATAWWCWHDFVPNEPGSGAVLVEEVAGTLHVTWNGVESAPAGVANTSTLQIQLELATGVVRQVFGVLSPLGSGTSAEESFLIGWSPGGPSVDAGAIDLATRLPFAVGAANLTPPRLSASPPPIVTPGAGVTVTYAVDDVPAFSPGTHVGFTIVSLAPDVAGTSLAALGMPGCAQHLATLDLFVLFVANGPSAATQLVLPPGVPGGTRLFAQAVALVPPGSLPNGQNALGAVVSNGVASFVNDH